MTKRELINICLELDGVYEDYPFDLVTDTPSAWTVMRHNGNHKGFAHIYGAADTPIINLKLPPFEGDMLRQTFEDIKPAYHMSKEHWSGIDPNGDVPFELLRGLIEKSYELTKLKRKKEQIKNELPDK
jgi:predicted DNA-binding protein (MmcQ/YjbR family)